MRVRIKTHPGYYLYDNGSVWSIKSNKFIASSIARGYEIVHLWKANQSTTISVHRLVATHFIPTKNCKLEVNHIDGNKLNNKVSNLEWVSRSENLLHSIRMGLRKSPRGNPKITYEIAQEIRELKGTKSYAKLAVDYGIKYSTVAHIMRGSRWAVK